jgi:hypothetical protein
LAIEIELIEPEISSDSDGVSEREDTLDGFFFDG